MRPTAAWIKHCLSKGDFRLSIHAIERSEYRLVTEEDIRHCGRTAKNVRFQEQQGTWRVIGLDTDGATLNVVCAIHGHLLVVTVF